LAPQYTVPNRGPELVQGKDVILPDARSMRVRFEAIASNESPVRADGVPGIALRGIAVGVYNGAFEDFAARHAANELEKATDIDEPLTVAEVANATCFSYERTVIRYESPAREEGGASRRGAAGSKLVESKTREGIDVAVIVGKRFETGPIVQIRPIPILTPGALPRVCRT